MTMNILPMTPQAAQSISGWRYPPPYDCYSFVPSDRLTNELLAGEYFAAYHKKECIGYYCFGTAARIPVRGENPYGKPALDVGLGLKPSLCGRGNGLAFLREGLSFAQKTFGPLTSFRLTVMEENLRAKTVYERAGFQIVCRIYHCSGVPFLVMERPAHFH